MRSAPVVSTPEIEAILSRPAHLLYAEEQPVPIAEYLRTSYRPDMDYVDGHLEVRNLGEYEHGQLQRILIGMFDGQAQEWNIRVAPETRLQVRPDRFRVPDLMVLSRAEEKPVRIVRTPPLLCVEVLSPEDTFVRIQQRVRDYAEMGVPNVWVLDPEDLGRVLIWQENRQMWNTDRLLIIPNTPIRIDLDVVAAKLAD